MWPNRGADRTSGQVRAISISQPPRQVNARKNNGTKLYVSEYLQLSIFLKTRPCAIGDCSLSSARQKRTPTAARVFHLSQVAKSRQRCQCDIRPHSQDTTHSPVALCTCWLEDRDNRLLSHIRHLSEACKCICSLLVEITPLAERVHLSDGNPLG